MSNWDQLRPSRDQEKRSQPRPWDRDPLEVPGFGDTKGTTPNRDQDQDRDQIELPTIWTEHDLITHLENCPHIVDISKLGDSEPRQMCVCGEASRHTPMAVARAELDMLTTEVDR